VIELSSEEARRLRARAHLIGGSSLSPAQVVERAVALQGQDLGAVMRAIALRSAPGTTLDDVRAAFHAGQIVRGWPMRGTVFATTLRDLAALHVHTRDRMLRSCLRRHELIGLTEAQLDLARETSRVALAGGSLSRDELCTAWREAGVEIGEGHGYHLVYHLSTEGLIHYAGVDGRDQRIALTPEVPLDDPEVELVRIVRGYFRARGPAALDDLAWWTKLPKAMLKRAAAEIEGLETVLVDGRELQLLDDGVAGGELPTVALIPAFDEWILGYGERGLVASPEAMRLVATVNGIFRPAVLHEGQVVGIWREPSSTRRTPEVDYVAEPTAAFRAAVDSAIAAWELR